MGSSRMKLFGNIGNHVFQRDRFDEAHVGAWFMRL